MKYGDLNLGQIEAVVNKLGGMEGVKKFLRDELIVSEPTRSWREENGVIRFSVTSDGTTREQWIARLESKGFRVGDCAKSVLRSKSFKPSSGVTYEIAVFKGELFSDNERITKNIRKEAKIRKLSIPNAEAACLIREKFSDKELKVMGLHWIVVMHKPFKDSGGEPLLLSAGHYGAHDSWLDALYGGPDGRWDRGDGFAFLAL